VNGQQREFLNGNIYENGERYFYGNGELYELYEACAGQLEANYSKLPPAN
jgi:hypothetical protein